MKRFYQLTNFGLALSLSAFILIPSYSNPKNNPAKAATVIKSAPLTMADDMAMLPASDAIAVVDVARAMNEVLPQIRGMYPDGIAKFEKELNDFIGKTGIDIYKIKSAVIGVNMSGKSNGGAAIIQGLTFDLNRISAALKEKKDGKESKTEINTLDYKGKQLFVVVTKKAGKAGIDEDMAFTQVDAERVAVGTISGVKGVLDGGSGTANAQLSELLSKTGTGFIRFAANLPESAKQGISEQGDLFKQFSTIKTVFGSLDMTSDLTVLLDAKMRTGSSDEASKLQTSLAGLVGMGKMFLGGNSDPQMKAINELLDLIKIGAQDSDVSLSLTVPRKVFDMLSETGKKSKTAK